MLEALTLVSYAILALLAVVIAVGILNMYRVMIYERTREIGTMRAIGVQRPQVRNIVLWEAFLLALCGILAGLVLSVIVLFAIAKIPFSGAAGFDIFLDRGHLGWKLYPDVVGLDAVLIALITVLGALRPRPGRRRPSNRSSQSELNELELYESVSFRARGAPHSLPRLR